jgi:hypothetical protein
MKFIKIKNTLFNIEQIFCIRMYIFTQIQVICADKEYYFTFDTTEQAEAEFLRLQEALS